MVGREGGGVNEKRKVFLIPPNLSYNFEVTPATTTDTFTVIDAASMQIRWCCSWRWRRSHLLEFLTFVSLTSYPKMGIVSC